MCVQVCEHVSPHGWTTKNLEKSLRLGLALRHRAVQKMSLSFAKPEGSSAPAGREQQEGASPL